MFCHLICLYSLMHFLFSCFFVFFSVSLFALGWVMEILLHFEIIGFGCSFLLHFFSPFVVGRQNLQSMFVWITSCLEIISMPEGEIKLGVYISCQRFFSQDAFTCRTPLDSRRRVGNGRIYSWFDGMFIQRITCMLFKITASQRCTKLKSGLAVLAVKYVHVIHPHNFRNTGWFGYYTLTAYLPATYAMPNSDKSEFSMTQCTAP